MSPARHARAVQICAFCPGLCRFACPLEAVTGREAATPRFMVGLLHHLRAGAFPWGEEAADAFSWCDGCGACEEVCEHSNPVREMLLAARDEARGRGHATALQGRVAENLAAGLGPGGQLLTAPLREGIPARPSRVAELLLWPSDRCLEAGPGALQATAAFLQHCDVDFALPPVEAYAPSPTWARAVGAGSLAEDLAARRRRAAAGYSRVFFEEPGECADAALGQARAVTWWDVVPEGGLELPVAGVRGYLPSTAGEGGFTELALSLGLEELAPARAPFASTGSGWLLDLLHPEASEALCDRIRKLVGGRGILVASPWTAQFLRAGGLQALCPANLRPRGGDGAVREGEA